MAHWLRFGLGCFWALGWDEKELRFFFFFFNFKKHLEISFINLKKIINYIKVKIIN